MKRSIYFLFFLAVLLLSDCREKIDDEEMAQIGIARCQRQPDFISLTGISPKRAAFSTSEKRIEGLVLIQLPENPADTSAPKTWQHPSWKRYGFMGPITTDNNGNVYTAPVPVINVLDNTPGKQDIIYKVEGRSGIMAPFSTLTAEINNPDNPYGLLGLYFDCHALKLYASSVSGSGLEHERGVLYAIDPKDGKVIDRLPGRDALGLCVGGITGQKRLYFGSSRTSDVYSVELTRNGKFTGGIKKEFSLDMLGPRGDDKARRIRFDPSGQLLVYGVEFNYNLTAPTEKQETLYRFRYDEEGKSWSFVK
jgi:outer membrane protein assembly factor BamB